MFEIGFSELALIAIVALVVVGPERLPRVARTAGLLLGRMQRYVNDVKADIHREIQLDELKRLQADMQASARDFERSVTDGIHSLERSARLGVEDVSAEVRALADAAQASPEAGAKRAEAAPESPAMAAGNESMASLAPADGDASASPSERA